MGRCLIQKRNNSVPLGTVLMTVSAVSSLRPWLGFDELATKSMLVGGWVKIKKLSGQTNLIGKYSYNTRGICINSQPDRQILSVLHKSGTNDADYSGDRSFFKMGWTHVVVIHDSLGNITRYENGVKRKTFNLAGYVAADYWYGVTGEDLKSNAGTQIGGVTCNLVFASTDNPARVLATDEQIRQLYETGAVPPGVAFWPMDEGTGTVCKAYINDAPYPALDGTLSAGNWIQDSPFSGSN